MSENINNKQTMDDFADELEASFRRINEGDVLKGTVIDVSEDEITLDLKYYAPGIIKAEEWSNDPNFSVTESIHVGDVLEATVIRRDDGAGNILLSMKEANEVLAWDKLQEYLEQDTILSVKISESVNGGVIAYLEGIRGFIPASQITTAYVEDTASYVGKTIEVRVITVDEDANRLVLSGKSVAAEKETEEHNHKVAMLVPGSVVEGTVESLQPYGAFVNLGNGLSGLVHISQICERRIKKPSEVLKEGQRVKAKILNTNDGKISLSMRALEEEMVDTTPSEEAADLSAYRSSENLSTSLGSLLSGLKL
ncbi:MAG: S1 RNA-binding domain-containing protein [Lachnospiraceae bacterium]|nr:S1 RNA-binding domain-containing protein [Lachnospiraceae bacterium]